VRQAGRPMPGQLGYYAPRTGVEIALAAAVVASTVASVVGAVAQGNAAAGAAAANADARRRAAALEEQQGATAYQRQQRINAINRGKSLAVLSSSGVDPTEGSPLDLLSQQAAEGEFQAEQAKFQHDQRAWQMRMGASQDDMAGAAAQSVATGKAIGAGISGLTRLGSMGLGATTGTPYSLDKDVVRTAGDRDLGGYQ
jgi:hypothetical protein